MQMIFISFKTGQNGDRGNPKPTQRGLRKDMLLVCS